MEVEHTIENGGRIGTKDHCLQLRNNNSPIGKLANVVLVWSIKVNAISAVIKLIVEITTEHVATTGGFTSKTDDRE